MSQISVQQILKDILDNDIKLLNSRDKLIRLLDEKVPARLSRDVTAVQKALQYGVGEYFLQAYLSNEQSSKRIALGKVTEKLKELNLQEKAIEKIINTFAYALNWNITTTSNYDLTTNELSNDSNLVQTIDGLQRQINALKKQLTDSKSNKVTINKPSLDKQKLKENILIILTQKNYIKRITLNSIRTQKSGGRGAIGIRVKENDYVKRIIIASTHDILLCFTNKGKVYQLNANKIPSMGKTSQGKLITNFLSLEKNETVVSILPIQKFDKDVFLLMLTGNGLIKRTELSLFDTNRKQTGILSLTLDKDDELISTKLTHGKSQIIIGTQNGMSICFNEQDIRPSGRTARGVKGISLKNNDQVISLDTFDNNKCEVLTVSENGFGKRTSISEYPIQSRSGVGLINTKITERTGLIIDLKIINKAQEFILISQKGIIIRSNIHEVSKFSRNTQGAKLISLEPYDKVSSLAIL